ncbi:levansucrase [Sphingobium subterraneum]|uniref:Levansucrase n=1 Tax=Sphingobium subterraneum TaxID=627688 RepID=A0A841J770_9SPHN|nr:levansucrase [Sphingobium subterraneum]
MLTAESIKPIAPQLDTWDMWPVETIDGDRAAIAGGTVWMALSAPILGDPILRHSHARIRLLHEVEGEWRDLGYLLPDNFGPGNRKWAGSAVLDENGIVTLFYTSAGNLGESGGYRQRICRTRATLDLRSGEPAFVRWSQPEEIIAADGLHYRIINEWEGSAGTIKAFRDPGFFRDPADGQHYLLFTASLAGSDHAFDGCIGIARSASGLWGQWQLMSPLISADGVNNELERPHIRHHNGLYYLFWSTQLSVFAPDGPTGPTGLYGMVGRSVAGPYHPLNGTGLVLANPPEEPAQTFSWLVLDDLRVASFIDSVGLGGAQPRDAAEARRHFGGCPAPMIRIALNGDKTSIVREAR